MQEASTTGAPFDRQRLGGRGVDHLISEYFLTDSPVRKQILGDYLANCMRVDEPCAYPHANVDVRVASREDLAATGRLTPAVLGTDERLPVALTGLNQEHTIYVPDHTLYLIDLRDSLIFWDQSVIADGLYIVTDIRHFPDDWMHNGHYTENLHGVYNINPSERTARIELGNGQVSLPDNSVYFLFHGFIATSFGHYLFDVLAQLIVYDKLKQQYGDALVPVIANEFWFKFKWPGMTWLFEKLVGNESDVVHVQRGSRIAVKRAFTTNRAVVADTWMSIAAIRYVRQRIMQAVQPTPGSRSKRRIYVSREDAYPRDVTNLADVKSILARYDFETVVIAELSPQQAFDTFYGAEVIAGMHGSGLMYHFYAKNPVTVIDIAFHLIPWQVILSTAQALGHTPVRINNVGTNADIEALEAALVTACGKH